MFMVKIKGNVDEEVKDVSAIMYKAVDEVYLALASLKGFGFFPEPHL